ncbi:tubulin-specific chaperone cofactor E-like protein [Lethenteron reissneri]|uniref:tubulin-specific chaperone cofactor E-like protein n=1 Tax=Lethenteron reissneri TaxID=7753 RepID=UPI002AB7D399|nr:tubulin-specific chaperone cofactor E-like protein [Lethenteron reissneri]XP_061411743.1 tubulin-specific chaperone cofactor E-like protein [Lethenteron reissneri]
MLQACWCTGVNMSCEHGRSLVDIIREKYNPDNYPVRRIILNTPPQITPRDYLNVPPILVLNMCDIAAAGDESQILELCSHVTELDLSHNSFKDWEEIGKIVGQMPRMQFLNLSANPLGACPSPPSLRLPSLRKLVLNNTKTSWETVHTLLRNMPQLEELFLCLNDYTTVVVSPDVYHNMKLLHITDNQLREWQDVLMLGLIFPSLETMVLSNNRVGSLSSEPAELTQAFTNLKHLNLHNWGLSDWSDVEKLNHFPSLEELRLLGIPLLAEYNDEQRRKLTVARLPSVQVLNGSWVSDSEREDAERFFIRYYMDFPTNQQPSRLAELQERHGQLEPLAEVDLTPQDVAQVQVHFDGCCRALAIRLDQTVAQLKRELREALESREGTCRIRIFHVAENMGAHIVEEMRFPRRNVHTYGVRDGDEIHVMRK